MSNEDIIEEILQEAHNLGILDKVLENYKKYSLNHTPYDSYLMSFNETRKQLNIQYNEVL